MISRDSVMEENPEIFSKNLYLNSVMKFCHGRHENARELFKKNFIMDYTVRAGGEFGSTIVFAYEFSQKSLQMVK